MTCGDIGDFTWSGVIMPSTCSLSNNQNDCQTVQPLNMTLQQELPVFDGNNNLTYRSIACARCNKGRNLSFWGLEVNCLNSLRPPQQDIAAVKKLLKKRMNVPGSIRHFQTSSTDTSLVWYTIHNVPLISCQGWL